MDINYLLLQRPATALAPKTYRCSSMASAGGQALRRSVVNWDLFPLNAVERLICSRLNPLFGLGTLGGAISLRTRSGFTSRGSSEGVGRLLAAPAVASCPIVCEHRGAGGLALPFSTSTKRPARQFPLARATAFLRGDWRGARACSPLPRCSPTMISSATDSARGPVIAERREAVFTLPRSHAEHPSASSALSGCLGCNRRAQHITVQVLSARRRSGGIQQEDIYEGFDDFSVERDLARTGLFKVVRKLPWCRVADVDRTEVLAGRNTLIHGPEGTNCASGSL